MPTTSATTRRFFLAGFMGAGKTTLGQTVARDLALPFFDLDERIALAASMSIEEIFVREGEAGFRARELEALRELVASAPEGVVALGGGTFTIEAHRALLQKAGTTVWLDVPIDELASRIAGDARPLWKNETHARELHARRASDYALADHRLDLAGRTVDEAKNDLRALLSRLRDER